MPELPEVETTRRGIAPHLEGQIVNEIIIRQPNLRWPVPRDLNETLTGLKIESIQRRAKYLLLHTQNGTLILHLGMSGSLRIMKTFNTADKHDHIDFIFKNSTLLRYNDPRRFGAVLWTTAPVNEHPLLKELGPEPLSTDFDGNYLYQHSKSRKVPIKSFIMNSHVVVGVGNIYANEVLFMANIHPEQQAGKISLENYNKLADCIKTVLANAIEQGGTTLRNFVNEAGKPGYFKQQLMAYGRGGMPCINCKQTLTEIRISNRTTVFCCFCQV